MSDAGISIDEIVDAHEARLGPLLPILHQVQEEFGYVSEEAIQRIAERLNLGRAEVSGVVGFYHDFKRKPDPRPVLKLCRAESCQARGSERLAKFALQAAGSRVRIETVYCLGLCSIGPNALAGGEVHARLDKDSLSAILERLP